MAVANLGPCSRRIDVGGRDGRLTQQGDVHPGSGRGDVAPCPRAQPSSMSFCSCCWFSMPSTTRVKSRS